MSASLISTASKCKTILKNYICPIKSDYNDYYLENIIIYFNIFKKEIIIEIISIILGIICFFFYNFLLISIIKLLSPIHIIFSTPLFFLSKKIIMPIVTLINEGTFFSKNHIENIYSKYILDLSGDIISSIGFIIYLEIIELNCCNLNYDLRRTIKARSQTDALIISDDEDDKVFVYLDNGDVEEVDKKSIIKLEQLKK